MSTNLRILCLFVLGVAGLCVWAYVTKQSECLGVYASPVVDGANAYRRETVLKAQKAITKGSTIRVEDVKEESVPLYEARNGALHSIDDVVDSTARVDIVAGQPIHFADIYPSAKIVVPVKNLSKGTVLSEEDLKVKRVKWSNSEPQKFDMVSRVTDAAGRILKRNISAGEQIKSEDLDTPKEK